MKNTTLLFYFYLVFALTAYPLYASQTNTCDNDSASENSTTALTLAREDAEFKRNTSETQKNRQGICVDAYPRSENSGTQKKRQGMRIDERS